MSKPPPHMTIHPSIHWLALAIAGVLSSCTAPAVPDKVPVSASLHSGNPLATQMFQAVNDYRRSQGARELLRHAGLDSLARKHCEYLRQHRGTFKLDGTYVSHVGFDGRSLVAREIYNMPNISENVAAASHAGANPVPSLMALLKNSKDHRKNMLDNWTHTGVGVVVDPEGMAYVTELFSTVSMSQMKTRQRFNGF